MENYNEKYDGLIESVNITKKLIDTLRENLKSYDDELCICMANIENNLDEVIKYNNSNNKNNEKSKLEKLEEEIEHLKEIITNMRLNQLPKVILPKKKEDV